MAHVDGTRGRPGWLRRLIAGLDTRLQLGTLVTPVTFRQPGIIAKAGATLSALTGGRTFCGIGAGWWPREHAAYGVDLPDARTRLDQLERSIMIMRALWAPGTKAFHSQQVTGGIDLAETTCYPRPAAPIPIIVGGNGERRTLRIAAAHGDACNLPSAPAVLTHKLSVLRRHCAAVGRDPAEVAITVLDLPVLGADRDDLGRRVEQLRGRLSAEAYVRSHPAGTAAEHIERYRGLGDLGVSTVFVSPADLTGPADLAGWDTVITGCR